MQHNCVRFRDDYVSRTHRNWKQRYPTLRDTLKPTRVVTTSDIMSIHRWSVLSEDFVSAREF